MKESHIDTTVLYEKGTLSLSDLLSENTPVFIKNHGRGALASASFRGTAASHTQVNWNGIKINSDTWEAGLAAGSNEIRSLGGSVAKAALTKAGEICIAADEPDNVVAETDESNNRHCWEINQPNLGQ